MMSKGGLVAPSYSNNMIGKEPSHSKYYYCCTMAIAVSKYETQKQYNSPHFLIQYSYNTGRFEVSSTCMYSSHGGMTKNTPGSLGVGFAMKCCYIMLIYSSFP